MSWLKQHCLNSLGTEHFVLSERVMSGAVNVENSVSQNGLIVAKALLS
jgi:hypothetical protein